MPIDTIWTERGIHWKCSGIVTHDEMVDTIINGFYQDARSNSVKYEIFDCLAAESLQFSKLDLVFFASRGLGRSRTLIGVKLAFVVKDPAILELVQIYIDNFNKIRNTWEIRIFDNTESAVAWAESS